MTVPPQLGKETPVEAVRRLLLGQLRHRRVRLATLGLAILVAAASFIVLTASAATTSVHVRQTLKQSFRGARSASISSAKQKVLCVSNFEKFACKTRMRLVCSESPGRTVLRRIPSSAYWAETWHVDFVPYHYWGANGPLVEGGRLSTRTPRGVRREEAVVDLAAAAPPGKQVLIWARCS
jgi:hypothetical protein